MIYKNISSNALEIQTVMHSNDIHFGNVVDGFIYEYTVCLLDTLDIKLDNFFKITDTGNDTVYSPSKNIGAQTVLIDWGDGETEVYLNEKIDTSFKSFIGGVIIDHSYNLPLGSIVTISIKTKEQMFIPVDKHGVEGVIEYKYFSGCILKGDLPFTNYDSSSFAYTDIPYHKDFKETLNEIGLPVNDDNMFKELSDSTHIGYMFSDFINLEKVDAGIFISNSTGIRNLTSIVGWFRNTKIETIPTLPIDTELYDISSLVEGNTVITNNGIATLKNRIPKVHTIDKLFMNCSSITSPGDLFTDVNIISAKYTFANCNLDKDAINYMGLNRVNDIANLTGCFMGNKYLNVSIIYDFMKMNTYTSEIFLNSGTHMTTEAGDIDIDTEYYFSSSNQVEIMAGNKMFKRDIPYYMSDRFNVMNNNPLTYRGILVDGIGEVDIEEMFYNRGALVSKNPIEFAASVTSLKYNGSFYGSYSLYGDSDIFGALYDSTQDSLISPVTTTSSFTIYVPTDEEYLLDKESIIPEDYVYGTYLDTTNDINIIMSSVYNNENPNTALYRGAFAHIILRNTLGDVVFDRKLNYTDLIEKMSKTLEDSYIHIPIYKSGLYILTCETYYTLPFTPIYKNFEQYDIIRSSIDLFPSNHGIYQAVNELTEVGFVGFEICHARELEGEIFSSYPLLLPAITADPGNIHDLILPDTLYLKGFLRKFNKRVEKLEYSFKNVIPFSSNSIVSMTNASIVLLSNSNISINVPEDSYSYISMKKYDTASYKYGNVLYNLKTIEVNGSYDFFFESNNGNIISDIIFTDSTEKNLMLAVNNLDKNNLLSLDYSSVNEIDIDVLEGILKNGIGENGLIIYFRNRTAVEIASLIGNDNYSSIDFTKLKIIIDNLSLLDEIDVVNNGEFIAGEEYINTLYPVEQIEANEFNTVVNIDEILIDTDEEGVQHALSMLTEWFTHIRHCVTHLGNIIDKNTVNVFNANTFIRSAYFCDDMENLIEIDGLFSSIGNWTSSQMLLLNGTHNIEVIKNLYHSAISANFSMLRKANKLHTVNYLILTPMEDDGISVNTVSNTYLSMGATDVVEYNIRHMFDGHTFSIPRDFVQVADNTIPIVTEEAFDGSYHKGEDIKDVYKYEDKLLILEDDRLQISAIRDPLEDEMISLWSVCDETLNVNIFRAITTPQSVITSYKYSDSYLEYFSSSPKFPNGLDVNETATLKVYYDLDSDFIFDTPEAEAKSLQFNITLSTFLTGAHRTIAESINNLIKSSTKKNFVIKTISKTFDIVFPGVRNARCVGLTGYFKNINNNAMPLGIMFNGLDPRNLYRRINQYSGLSPLRYHDFEREPVLNVIGLYYMTASFHWIDKNLLHTHTDVAVPYVTSEMFRVNVPSSVKVSEVNLYSVFNATAGNMVADDTIFDTISEDVDRRYTVELYSTEFTDIDEGDIIMNGMNTEISISGDLAKAVSRKLTGFNLFYLKTSVKRIWSTRQSDDSVTYVTNERRYDLCTQGPQAYETNHFYYTEATNASQFGDNYFIKEEVDLGDYIAIRYKPYMATNKIIDSTNYGLISGYNLNGNKLESLVVIDAYPPYKISTKLADIDRDINTDKLSYLALYRTVNELYDRNMPTPAYYDGYTYPTTKASRNDRSGVASYYNDVMYTYLELDYKSDTVTLHGDYPHTFLNIGSSSTSPDIIHSLNDENAPIETSKLIVHESTNSLMFGEWSHKPIATDEWGNERVAGWIWEIDVVAPGAHHFDVRFNKDNYDKYHLQYIKANDNKIPFIEPMHARLGIYNATYYDDCQLHEFKDFYKLTEGTSDSYIDTSLIHTGYSREYHNMTNPVNVYSGYTNANPFFKHNTITDPAYEIIDASSEEDILYVANNYNYKVLLSGDTDFELTVLGKQPSDTVSATNVSDVLFCGLSSTNSNNVYSSAGYHMFLTIESLVTDTGTHSSIILSTYVPDEFDETLRLSLKDILKKEKNIIFDRIVDNSYSITIKCNQPVEPIEVIPISSIPHDFDPDNLDKPYALHQIIIYDENNNVTGIGTEMIGTDSFKDVNSGVYSTYYRFAGRWSKHDMHRKIRRDGLSRRAPGCCDEPILVGESTNKGVIHYISKYPSYGSNYGYPIAMLANVNTDDNKGLMYQYTNDDATLHKFTDVIYIPDGDVNAPTHWDYARIIDYLFYNSKIHFSTTEMKIKFIEDIAKLRCVDDKLSVMERADINIWDIDIPEGILWFEQDAYSSVARFFAYHKQFMLNDDGTSKVTTAFDAHLVAPLILGKSYGVPLYDYSEFFLGCNDLRIKNSFRMVIPNTYEPNGYKYDFTRMFAGCNMEIKLDLFELPIYGTEAIYSNIINTDMFMGCYTYVPRDMFEDKYGPGTGVEYRLENGVTMMSYEITNPTEFTHIELTGFLNHEYCPYVTTGYNNQVGDTVLIQNDKCEIRIYYTDGKLYEPDLIFSFSGQAFSLQVVEGWKVSSLEVDAPETSWNWKLHDSRYEGRSILKVEIMSEIDLFPVFKTVIREGFEDAVQTLTIAETGDVDSIEINNSREMLYPNIAISGLIPPKHYNSENGNPARGATSFVEAISYHGSATSISSYDYHEGIFDTNYSVSIRENIYNLIPDHKQFKSDSKLKAVLVTDFHKDIAKSHNCMTESSDMPYALDRIRMVGRSKILPYPSLIAIGGSQDYYPIRLDGGSRYDLEQFYIDALHEIANRGNNYNTVYRPSLVSYNDAHYNFNNTAVIDITLPTSLSLMSNYDAENFTNLIFGNTVELTLRFKTLDSLNYRYGPYLFKILDTFIGRGYSEVTDPDLSYRCTFYLDDGRNTSFSQIGYTIQEMIKGLYDRGVGTFIINGTIINPHSPPA